MKCPDYELNGCEGEMYPLVNEKTGKHFADACNSCGLTIELEIKRRLI